MKMKEARAKKLYTMRALADVSGVSLATIRNIEQGKVTPSLGVIQKLVTKLEIDPEEIDEFRMGIEAASRGKKAS